MKGTTFPYKKLFISIPILMYSIFIYGKIKEQGDINAAGMYLAVFFLPTLVIAVLSYVIFYITDKVTGNHYANFIKIFSHFILVIFPLFLWSNWKFLIWTQLTIIAFINLTELMSAFRRIRAKQA